MAVVSYTTLYNEYHKAHPDWSESTVKQWARTAYNAQFVNTDKPTTPSTPTQTNGPTIGGSSVNNTGVGTLGPSAKAQNALAGVGDSGVSTKKTNTGAYEGTVLGVDSSGNTIKSTISFAQGSEQSYINGLPPADRAALQQKMFKLKLYPNGYKPPAGGLVTPEDFQAIKQLQVLGVQIGKGDINDIIAEAQKNPKYQAFLTSGGYKTAATVSLTDTAEATSTLNDFFLNTFNEKPTKEEIKAYQSALNAREKSSKNALTSQERQDILYSVANKRLASLSGAALAGDTKATEALTEGQMGKRIRELRAAYDENGMSVSDRTLYKLAGQSFRSQEAYDNIIENINQNVGLQWGQLGQNLKPGQTVRARLQPYISWWSGVSGIPEDSIKTSDLQDIMNPDGTYKNLQQYKTIKYKSKEYLATDNYKQTVFDDTTAVLRNFGIG